jgi:hypothetical protein
VLPSICYLCIWAAYVCVISAVGEALYISPMFRSFRPRRQCGASNEVPCSLVGGVIPSSMCAASDVV